MSSCKITVYLSAVLFYFVVLIRQLGQRSVYRERFRERSVLPCKPTMPRGLTGSMIKVTPTRRRDVLQPEKE